MASQLTVTDLESTSETYIEEPVSKTEEIRYHADHPRSDWHLTRKQTFSPKVKPLNEKIARSLREYLQDSHSLLPMVQSFGSSLDSPSGLL